MKDKASTLITRRRVIGSLAAVAAGALVKPRSVFGFDFADNKTRFAVVGDFGTGGSDECSIAASMLAAHHKSPFDLVVAAGDNIYPNGSGRYFTKHFEEPFSGLIKERVKFYAVLGNHDVEEGRKDQMSYPMFSMEGSNYYSISRNNGMVDFFMLDSTDLGATQLSWLEKSLRESRAIWKLAVLHHPIYSSGKKHGSDLRLRKQLEPLFTHYHVQAVFSGHDHVYERTKPQQGIQYFVTGAGGKCRRGDINMKSEIRAASYDVDNSFMVIEADEREMSFKSISDKGEVVDSGVIKLS